MQKKRQKEREQAEKDREESIPLADEELVYDQEVNDLKCILFFHGGESRYVVSSASIYFRTGGYYFGSTDQER